MLTIGQYNNITLLTIGQYGSYHLPILSIQDLNGLAASLNPALLLGTDST